MAISFDDYNRWREEPDGPTDQPESGEEEESELHAEDFEQDVDTPQDIRDQTLRGMSLNHVNWSLIDLYDDCWHITQPDGATDPMLALKILASYVRAVEGEFQPVGEEGERKEEEYDG